MVGHCYNAQQMLLPLMLPVRLVHATLLLVLLIVPLVPVLPLLQLLLLFLAVVHLTTEVSLPVPMRVMQEQLAVVVPQQLADETGR